MNIREFIKKPIFRTWKFWVGFVVISVVASLLLQVAMVSTGMVISTKEWFFRDSTNFTTWTRDHGYERSYVKSVTLRKDSTFTIESEVEGYGTVEMSGTFTVEGDYDMWKEDISLYKELEKQGVSGKYSRVMLKFNEGTSSFHVLGNPYLGMPYRLEKPGQCGSRNYRNFYDYILIGRNEDRSKVTRLGVVYSTCQEMTGKMYKHCEWFTRN